MGQNYFFGCISFNSKVIWPNLVRSEILNLGTLDLETAVGGTLIQLTCLFLSYVLDLYYFCVMYLIYITPFLLHPFGILYR